MTSWRSLVCVGSRRGIEFRPRSQPFILGCRPSPGRCLGLRRSLGWLFGRLQVDGAGLAPLVLLDVVGDALVLLQRAHSGPLHRGNMDERVISAAVRLNEAIALGFVEKFYGADRHDCNPS